MITSRETVSIIGYINLREIGFAGNLNSGNFLVKLIGNLMNHK